MQLIVADLLQHIFRVVAGIRLGNRRSIDAERPAGILIRIERSNTLHVVFVRIHWQRVSQRNGGNVAEII